MEKQVELYKIKAILFFFIYFIRNSDTTALAWWFDH